MRYNLHEEQDYSLLYIIKALVEVGGDNDSSNIDICLTVNGKELDFIAFCDRIRIGINEDINERAKELIKERGQVLLDNLYTAIQNAEFSITEATERVDAVLWTTHLEGVRNASK